MNTTRMMILLESNAPPVGSSALPVLVSIQSHDDKLSKLCKYLGEEGSNPQFVADDLLCNVIIMMDAQDKNRLLIKFKYFNLHSGTEYTIEDSTFPVEPIKVGNKLIYLYAGHCMMYQVHEDGAKNILGNFPINHDSVCMSPDKQCMAFVAGEGGIMVLDLKNGQEFFIDLKEKLHPGCLMLNHNHELFIFNKIFNKLFYKNTKEPSTQCLRYKLDWDKQTVSDPENIVIDLDYDMLKSPCALTDNRMVVFARAPKEDEYVNGIPYFGPDRFVGKVYVCTLDNNSIKAKKEVGDIFINSTLQVFNLGNSVVFQDGRKLKVLMGDDIYSCDLTSDGESLRVKRIILSSPNVACLVLEGHNSFGGVYTEIKFLKVPKAIDPKLVNENLVGALPCFSSSLAGVVQQYLGLIWVDADARLPIEGEPTQAFSVSEVTYFEKPTLLEESSLKSGIDAEVKVADEVKSSTPESELEKLCRKIEEKQTTIYADELFLPVYKWLEQGVALVKAKYDEAKLSGDAKAIPIIDSFKRKIDAAFSGITTYTTSIDKTAALKPMRDALTTLILMDNHGFPDFLFLNQQMKRVIGVIEPHIPKPAATAVASVRM